MKKLYIIPGWQETCRRRPYQTLIKFARKKGYEVICKNVAWDKILSSQTFPADKDSVVLGWSLGAILAWMVAQENECQHLILASMTPHYSWKDKEIKKALVDLTGAKFISDITKKIGSKTLARKQTIMYGEREDEPADIIIPKTEHELNERYIKAILKLL